MQDPSYRLELLRVSAADSEPTAEALAGALEVAPEEALAWTRGEVPRALREGMNVAEAERVAKLGAKAGAYLAVVNERTGVRRYYPSEPPSPEEPGEIEPGASEPSANPKAPKVFEPEPSAVPRTPRPAATLPARPSATPKKLREARPLEQRRQRTPSAPAEKVSLLTVLTPAQRKRLLVIAGVAALLALLLSWWSREPDAPPPDVVDGPYRFGPPGYDYVER